MKKTLLLAVIFILAFSTSYYAQGRMSPSERTSQLTEQLKLNKDQAKKIEGIYTKQQEKMSEIFQNGGGFGDEATRNKMTALRDSTNSNIMKLLTANQKDEFKKIIEEQQKRMEEMRRNMGN